MATMWRRYDWACAECDTTTDELIDIPEGGDEPSIGGTTDQLECAACGGTVHRRIPSLPAQYMGDRPRTPLISGSDLDTTGHRELPDIPEVPGAEEHGRKVAAAIRAAVESGEDERIAALDACKDGPTVADYIEHVKRPDVQHAIATGDRIAAENEKKQERYAALKAGATVDFRTDRCPGDPPEISE